MLRKICCYFNVCLIQQVNQRLKSIASQNSQGGFALPTALMFGLVMLVGVSSLLIRSSDDRVSASMQQQADASLNVTDGGVSRIQAFLAANPLLAQHNLGDWQNSSVVANLVSFANSCTDRTTAQTQIRNFITAVTSWQNIDAADASRGQFRLANYTYTPSGSPQPDNRLGTGVLEIEGRIPNQQSINRLRITIPVLPGDVDGVPIPGVWLTQGDVGNNTIQGNVLLNDCSVPPNSVSVAGTDPTTGNPFSVRYTTLRLPTLPNRPSFIPNSLPSRINDNVTLPRLSGPVYSRDIPTIKTIRGEAVQVYEYAVDSLDIANSKTLTITPGTRVTFYLNGDIKPGGDIEHNCGNTPDCRPTNFQIFGYGLENGARRAICLNGNRFVDAFVLAPNYMVGIAGSGGGQGGIRGSVWTNEWSNSRACGSNTTNRTVVQTANWDFVGVMPQNLPPKIAPASSWERVDLSPSS